MTPDKKPERDCDSMEVRLYNRGWNDAIDALYTTPPAQRKPLTDEEIAKAIGTNARWPYLSEMLQITRAIEAAHGIKGDA